MASIAAGRALAAARAKRESAAAKPFRIVTVDGARRIGAKILVAGGGRCNVTHHAVSEKEYAGGDATREPAGSGDALKRTHDSVRRVLRRFDVRRTAAFFESIGVTLKREETGKLFPTTDDAHTVLDALLQEARGLGVKMLHPWRVGAVTREADSGDFLVSRSAQLDGTDVSRADPGGEFARMLTLRARRVILATGGMALPKTGSDGGGYALAKALGHSVTPRIFPALVPLVVNAKSFIRELSGLTVPARVEVRLASGKKVASFQNSLLCTHFGLSGPAALDASRYYLDAACSDPRAELRINWVPGLGASGIIGVAAGASPAEALDALLVSRRGISPARLLTEPPCSLPDRLARALCAHAGVDASATTEHLTRDRRRALASAVTQMAVPVTGDRGFTFAEATAGGVPLDELELSTMESKRCPRLHLCGELCDVDGRIGGFNFQWAWSSGWVAGEAAAAAST